MPEQCIKTVFPGESHPTSCQQGLCLHQPARTPLEEPFSGTGSCVTAEPAMQTRVPSGTSDTAAGPGPGAARLAATVSPPQAQRVESSCSGLQQG